MDGYLALVLNWLADKSGPLLLLLVGILLLFIPDLSEYRAGLRGHPPRKGAARWLARGLGIIMIAFVPAFGVSWPSIRAELSRQAANTNTPQPTASSSQTHLPSPIPTNTTSPSPISQLLSTPTQTPSETPASRSVCGGYAVNITEIMMIAPTPNPNRISEPCVSYGEICNEYIEICNYGDSPVDTRGWWIADRGGHPGELIPWNEVNEGVLVGSAEIATSIIPAGRCALILPSIYANGDWPYNRMLSPAAIILTLRNAAFIGDSLLGRGSDDARDVLVLYIGDESSIECVLSTYGSPEGALVGGHPEQIADPGSDAIPFNHPYGISGGPCRFDVASDDTASNWGFFTISDMSPGEMGGNCSPLP